MEIKSKKSLFVRSLAVDDVKEAVNLHIECFPNNFLSHLGPNFLSIFYLEFVKKEGNYGLIVHNNGKIIGSLLGTSSSYNEFYLEFYKKIFWKLSFLVFSQILIDKHLRRNIWSKKEHFYRACKSIFKKNKKVENDRRSVDSQIANLQSIYIDPQFRGSGGAKLLIDSFCNNLYLDGVKKVVLSVESNNKRAISFYKKCGWDEVEKKEHEIVFYKNLVEKIKI